MNDYGHGNPVRGIVVGLGASLLVWIAAIAALYYWLRG